MDSPSDLANVGLFAGIGGIELGLAFSGIRSELLCEYWQPAAAVLANRFEGVPIVGDVREIKSLPKADLVSAGFPCTDLSQAGLTRGIAGGQSGLISELFRLIRRPRPPVLVLENVRNMLVLDGGRAMRYLVDELEQLGYRWAYRLVDSRFTGVPQRRQRVIFVAARKMDPRTVVLADDAGEPADGHFASDAFGFYWTEGLRGLGWARDAVPTLKGGSTVGIPSPPGIWWPSGPPGSRLITPVVEETERLQGFPPGWTEPANEVSVRKGSRWKLVGNAVTVGVSKWLGSRITAPGEPLGTQRLLTPSDRWPTAAFGWRGKSWAVDVSMWPRHEPYQHLSDVVDLAGAPPLSLRGSTGFLERAGRSTLRFSEGFLEDVEDHIAHQAGERSVA